MPKFQIREEIPIKSFSIAAFIVKKTSHGVKYLIIRRSSETLNGNWQMVSGKLEEGENAVEATLREIKEETGLIPNRLYSTNLVEQFYDTDYHVINLVPVFLAFADQEAEVILNPYEHDAYQWIGYEEAENYLEFDNQIENIMKIHKRFIEREPTRFLEIDLDNY